MIAQLKEEESWIKEKSRIIEKLCGCGFVVDSLKIKLRRATIDDAEILLEWRNDPETRKVSMNMDIVKWDEHITWLTGVLANPDRELYIAELNGVPVGTIRNDSGELSWTVAPEHRQKGIGKRMVALIDGPVRAKIKHDNLASIKIAESVGMTMKGDYDGIIFYSRDQ